MDTLRIGDKVVWHTGFYAGDMGQEHVWWPADKVGIIIRIENNKYLLEMEDGTREWAVNTWTEGCSIQAFEIVKAESAAKAVRLKNDLANILPVKFTVTTNTGNPSRHKMR